MKCGHDLVITFESWCTRAEWWAYAEQHADILPRKRRLVDRSPCMDPFFDPFNEGLGGYISGLCRGIKNFHMGQRLLYLTRPAPDISSLTRIGGKYFVVAHLQVEKIFESHEAAATCCKPGHYTDETRLTARPPNILASDDAEPCLPRDRCIVYEETSAKSQRPLTPTNATYEVYEESLKLYRVRRDLGNLKVARCKIVNSVVDPDLAPLADLPCLRHRGILAVGQSCGRDWFEAACLKLAPSKS